LNTLSNSFGGLGLDIPVSSFRRKPESSGAERANKKLDPGFRRGDVDARDCARA
jgi:hypothetical protein